QRKVIMVRETPLNLAHLRNMTAVTEMGGRGFPPLPAFYHRPASNEEMVDHTEARVLELFDIHEPGPHWEGMK
ncbi:flavoprotein, partial [Achromobacter xylosoxidans]|uniref:flavoprotein n=1 Tax=Alcaligenes xylosoxydans xylosoxydans TaxID=85698 RepID=UPI0037673AC1